MNLKLKAMRLSFPPHVTHGEDINALIDYAEALIDYAEALKLLLEEVQEALYRGRSATTIGAIIHYGLQSLEDE
jgi:hypothetical protein